MNARSEGTRLVLCTRGDCEHAGDRFPGREALPPLPGFFGREVFYCDSASVTIVPGALCGSLCAKYDRRGDSAS